MTTPINPPKPTYRSFAITKGDERAPNRSMLRGIGYQDADFDKPFIGLANGHSTLNPCNAGIQPLADAADAAIRAAGGMPQMFGTITVTDGISMGTEGMKYSLVSREVIADSIETAVQSQFMDGVLAIGGCDKNMPGAMIGLCRMNLPAIFVYGGTIKPGHHKGEDLQIVSVFEAVGSLNAGKMSREDFECIERCALPGTGACDYIHVTDLAAGHVRALQHLEKAPGCLTLNLGSGQGHSVLEMVRAFEQASGRTIAHRFAPRRAGDLPAFWANADEARRILGWEARCSLLQMCEDTWRFQTQSAEAG